jgi:hypothetical protein
VAMHRLHQREVTQRYRRQGGRNHRMLHVIKSVCAMGMRSPCLMEGRRSLLAARGTRIRHSVPPPTPRAFVRESSVFGR